eukprot:COSAG04_NODE_6393_length_1339_cov_1.329032_2_plen_184_part_00
MVRHLILAGAVFLLLGFGAFLCGKCCGSSTERKKQRPDAMPDLEQPKESSRTAAPGSQEPPTAEATVAQPNGKARGSTRVVARAVQSTPTSDTARRPTSQEPAPIPRGATPPREGAATRGATPPRDSGGAAPKPQSALKQYAALSMKVRKLSYRATRLRYDDDLPLLCAGDAWGCDPGGTDRV